MTGFARGEATIAGIDEYDGQSLRIAFQNEFLIAQTEDEVLATTPDLITIARRRNWRADHDRESALRIPRLGAGDAVRSTLAHARGTGRRRTWVFWVRSPLCAD